VKYLLTLFLFLNLGADGKGNRDEMELPVATQIPLLLKVLAFDRQLLASEHSEIVVGIVFQSGNRESSTAKTEAIRVIEESRLAVAGRPVRAVAIDLDREELETAMVAKHLCALYVTPLRAIDIADIAAAAQASKVRTLTGVPRYVARGIGVGVRLIGDRPKLMVNVTAARLEGADFSAELLKLAQVTQ
jgi:hypothetical protein